MSSLTLSRSPQFKIITNRTLKAVAAAVKHTNNISVTGLDNGNCLSRTMASIDRMTRKEAYDENDDEKNLERIDKAPSTESDYDEEEHEQSTYRSNNPKEDDEDDVRNPDQEFNKNDDRWVQWSRILVFVVIALAAISIATVAYHVVEKEEVEDFESQVSHDVPTNMRFGVQGWLNHALIHSIIP